MGVAFRERPAEGGVGVSAARSRGTSFETALMRYLRENGFDVERLRQAGAQDEGDLVVKDGGVTIIEAKATRRLDTASGVREALAEKVNYAKHRGLDPDDITGVMVWKVRVRGEDSTADSHL